MKIQVKRIYFGDNFTIGKMFIDGEDVKIYVLEDKFREVEGLPVSKWKIPNTTAIPKGMYKVIFDFSNRFKKIMPHILDVPGFEGVRIHAGNTDENTEGCLLLGLTWNGKSDFIGSSVLAINKFTEKVKNAAELTIEIG